MGERNLQSPNICLWHLSSWEILQYCWFYLQTDADWVSSIPDFSGKYIVDFACGFSDLLYTISQVSQPTSLTGVDIIFENQLKVLQAEKDLHEHISIFRSTFIRQLQSWEQKAHQTIVKLKERLSVLLRFPHAWWIDYRSSLEQEHEWKIDIMFINFLLYRFDSPELFLRDLKKFLSPTGKIIVVDFWILRRNISPEILKPISIQKGFFSGEIKL